MPGYRRAYRTARKLYPLMLMAYRRWDSMSQEEKQRYIDQAKRYSRQASTYARQAASRAPRRKRPR
ncbi:MAG TPA: hypothetical protein VF032_11170 [Thermoleophilaceae bacterium]